LIRTFKPFGKKISENHSWELFDSHCTFLLPTMPEVLLN